MAQIKKLVLLIIPISILFSFSSLFGQTNRSLQKKITQLEQKLNKQEVQLSTAQNTLLTQMNLRLKNFYEGQNLFLEDLNAIKQKQQKITDQYERMQHTALLQDVKIQMLENKVAALKEKIKKQYNVRQQKEEKQRTSIAKTKKPILLVSKQEKAILKKAYTYLKQNDTKHAAKTFDELYHFNKVGAYAPLALFSIGKIYFDQKQSALAASYFIKVLSLFPSKDIHNTTQWFLARTYEQQKHYSQAKDLYQTLASKSGAYAKKAQARYNQLSNRENKRKKKGKLK